MKTKELCPSVSKSTKSVKKWESTLVPQVRNTYSLCSWKSTNGTNFWGTKIAILFVQLWSCHTPKPLAHIGEKSTFYPEIPLILMFQKCEFCGKWDFRNVNFVKIGILEMWILWKMSFQKCDFWKMWFSICEFLDKMWIFVPEW